MKNLAKAVIAVMKDVKGMEKKSRVGSGGSAYNGTKDMDVKEVFNEAMAKHGLCMIPQNIEEETMVDRWEESVQYNKALPPTIKQKQSVFTKVRVHYLLLHESGESTVVAGYGHGVDPQDKGAGKATTYAMKNALLYTFLTPVGKIDDTELTHSDEIPVKPVKKAPAKKAAQAAPAQPESNEALGMTKEATEAAIKAAKSKSDLGALRAAINVYKLNDMANAKVAELKASSK